MKLEEQYDRIYKYLYFRLHDENIAEDLTQEAFLRFLGSRTYRDENRQLQYLYTIARNLCNQHYRDRTFEYSLDDVMDRSASDGFEQPLLQQMLLTDALQRLSPDEREMLFLQYINEVPVPVIGRLYDLSRFAVYRKLNSILKKLRNEMEKEGQDGK